MNVYKKERERRGRSKISRHGTTLIEAIAALFIISLTATSSIYTSQLAFKSIGAAKDKLIAQNLAREGIEAARNSLYTNLLRYGGKQCWNKKQPPCDEGNKLNGPYAIKNYLEYGEIKTSLEEKTSQFYLSDDPSNPEKKKPNPEYVVSLKKIGSEAFMTNAAGSSGAEETKFHRKIDIDYDDSNPDGMIVRSTVAWMQGDELKETKRESVFNKK